VIKLFGRMMRIVEDEDVCCYADSYLFWITSVIVVFSLSWQFLLAVGIGIVKWVTVRMKILVIDKCSEGGIGIRMT